VGAEVGAWREGVDTEGILRVPEDSDDEEKGLAFRGGVAALIQQPAGIHHRRERFSR
jgi:hypothetical protein